MDWDLLCERGKSEDSEWSKVRDEELDIIVSCVEKYKSIIENRRTNKISQDAKQQAWENIAAEFRFWPGVRPISAKQIKKCWENLKARARQEQKLNESQLGQDFQIHELAESNFTRRIDRVRSIIGSTAEADVDPYETFVKVEVQVDEGVETITSEGLRPETPVDDSSGVPTNPLENLNSSTDATTTAELTGYSDCNNLSTNPEFITPNHSTYKTSYNRIRRRRAKIATPYSRPHPDPDTSENQARLNMLQQKMKQDSIEHEARMEILKLEKAYWEAKVTQALMDTQSRDHTLD
ncbi:unnamed protein product [Allacma fusca]|uniref:Regulatory protein zeste n=1 Tax=Allacma fusca TaxID=39272 RepID=A0A8J2P126_9HEXA|nr:unnamed protein product [Allacma fusca]